MVEVISVIIDSIILIILLMLAIIICGASPFSYEWLPEIKRSGNGSLVCTEDTCLALSKCAHFLQLFAVIRN